MGFLFTNFLYKFSTFFLLENVDSNKGSSSLKKSNLFTVDDTAFTKFYDMQSTNFRNFLIQVIYNLEPYHLQKGVIMVNELDEIGEIIFVHQGSVGIGYELNKFKKVVFQYNNKCVIGAFYATFN